MRTLMHRGSCAWSCERYGGLSRLSVSWQGMERGGAGLGPAGLGKARRGRARHGLARQGKAGNAAWPGKAGLGEARPGKARDRLHTDALTVSAHRQTTERRAA